MDQPEDLGGPALATTALWELSKRLDATPSDPWIFFRPSWRWRWRSWAEVADQMARGVVVLRRAAESAPQEIESGAFADRRDPDALVTSLTLRAAGFRPRPVDVEGNRPAAGSHPAAHLPARTLWVRGASGETSDPVAASPSPDPSAGLEEVVLPAVRSRFETAPLESPDLPKGPNLDEPVPVSVGKLVAGLRASVAEPSKRAARPILCAGPDLSSATFQALLVSTLASDAAWVLEADPDIFPAAASWARPTALVATPRQAGEVLDELGRSRRWRRLRQLWLLSSGASEDDASTIRTRCAELGVVAEPLPSGLTESLAA